MTEEKSQPFQFAGAGQPQETSTPATPDGNGGGETQTANVPAYVTKDEVEQLFDQMYRRVQSLTDKQAARVEKVLKAAEARGISMTTEQAKELAAAAMDGEEPSHVSAPAHSQAAPASPARPAQAEPEPEPELHPVLFTANEMMRKAGVTIEDEDPELSLIDRQTTDEFTFLASIKNAIDAKRTRLGKAGDPARLPSLTGPGRPANPVREIKDPNELWRLATQRK
jgi:hypothetical protein